MIGWVLIFGIYRVNVGTDPKCRRKIGLKSQPPDLQLNKCDIIDTEVFYRRILHDSLGHRFPEGGYQNPDLRYAKSEGNVRARIQ